MLAGYIAGGAAAWPLVAALAGTSVAASRIARPLASEGAIGIGVVGLFGLLFIGRFFGALTTERALVLFFAPLLCWVTELPLLRHRKPWLVGLLRLVLVALPLVNTDDQRSSLAVGLSLAVGFVELILDAFPGIALRFQTHMTLVHFATDRPAFSPVPIDDQHIVDQNNGERHEAAFVGLVKNQGLLHEAELIPRSYGGNSWFAKFHPAAAKELLASLPVAIKGVLKGKINPKIAIFGHKIPAADLKNVQRIYDKVESREERFELNLYITGYDEVEDEPAPVGAAAVTHEPGGKEPFPGPGAEPTDTSAETRSRDDA